ncbi:hypothetical protein J1N35_002564 [Gossypium stocksii]|uniref:Uncharacterized protein n=1 Tax=Gossypium stocksii TaxID=47602 RepID=A0A9D3WLY6_9ROSI|nr:hypothetical protein J1N35_002564 [Gossypium stocksii]
MWGEIVASKTIIHSEILSPFAMEAHARLQAIQLDNKYAHFLTKEALRKGEGHYLLGTNPSHAHQERER